MILDKCEIVGNRRNNRTQNIIRGFGTRDTRVATIATKPTIRLLNPRKTKLIPVLDLNHKWLIKQPHNTSIDEPLHCTIRN